MTVTAPAAVDLPAAPPADAPFAEAAAALPGIVAEYRAAAAVAAEFAAPPKGGVERMLWTPYSQDFAPTAFLAAQWNRAHGAADTGKPATLDRLVDEFGIWRDKRCWRELDTAWDVLPPAYKPDVDWTAEPQDWAAPYSDPITGHRLAEYNAQRSVTPSRSAARAWASLRNDLRPVAQDHWRRVQPHIDFQLRRSEARLTEALQTARPAPPTPTKGRPSWR